MNVDDMNEEELDRFARRTGSFSQKKLVARNPSASLETLHYLFDQGFEDDVYENPMFLIHVAAGEDVAITMLSLIINFTDKGDLLREFSSCVWSVVRSSVGNNSNTPADLLQALAKDEDATVRASVAENRNTPADLLWVLAIDPVDMVRESAAINQKLPVERMSILVHDHSVVARRNLANNRSVPDEIIRKLACDLNASVAMLAKTRLVGTHG